MAQAEHTHTHTHEEHKKFSPKSEVQEVGPCKLQLRIEIAAERIKEEIDHKYKDLNDSMALPGFRKGHAPRNVLERKFGKALLDDLKFELLSEVQIQSLYLALRYFTWRKEDKFYAKIAAQSHWDDPIVTEITPLKEFYAAEGYHQNYYNDNPNQGYCSFVIRPKVKKLQDKGVISKDK